MQENVARRLEALNQTFYDSVASVFTASRGRTEPGLDRIVERIRPGQRVLDLGCGQARLGTLLPQGCAYTGVDYSGAMLEHAERALEETNISAAKLVQAAITDGGWVTEVGSDFDWVMMRAVLHHIPGYISRRRAVALALSVLAPAGRLAVANWQFLDVARLRRRVLPWSAVGLTEADVEPGDYLLDWRRGSVVIRYVHLVDEAETRRLAEDLGLEVEELFRADGHTGDLTLYAILRRPG
jgi:SAM-dependent methyltransferase